MTSINNLFDSFNFKLFRITLTTRYTVADVEALREQLNISQSEIAKSLGTCVNTIKSWKSRRRNPTELAVKRAGGYERGDYTTDEKVARHHRVQAGLLNSSKVIKYLNRLSECLLSAPL